MKKLFFLAAVCMMVGIVSPVISADETKSKRVICGEDFVSVIWVQDGGVKWFATRKSDVISVTNLPKQYVAVISLNRTKIEGILTVWVAIEDFEAIVDCLD